MKNESHFHEGLPINTLVRFSAGVLTGTGRIVGEAATGVFTTYIVLLDKCLNMPGFEGWGAVAVPGQCLTRISEQEHWDAVFGPLRACSKCGSMERLDMMPYDKTMCGRCYNKR